MNEKKSAQQAASNDFVRGVVTELRRVTWPSQNEWMAATIMTLGLVIGLGFLTWGLDNLFGYLFTQLHLSNI